MKLSTYFLALCFLLFSCKTTPPKPPCNNRLSVFKSKEPTNSFYQRLMLNILKESKPEDFRYFFKTFTDKDDKVFITINMRNETHCFDAFMLVKNMEPFRGGMYRTNGKSYPEELNDVKWEIDESFDPPLLTFLDMGEIID